MESQRSLRTSTRGARLNRRRDILRGALISSSWHVGRTVNRFANPLIGAAAADVSGHGGVDLRIGGFRGLGEQRRCGHDLSRLAVAALRYVHIDPSALHGVA